MKFILGMAVGSCGPWVLAVVLHHVTQRRLPVRTDFLMAPPFVGPLHHFSRDGE